MITCDLIETHKILIGFSGILLNHFFTLTTNSRTKDTVRNFIKKEVKLNICKYFFSNCVTSCWNSLPDFVITAESINSFKI